MTYHALHELPLRREGDPLAGRQQARCATRVLGFSAVERTRVATAVSEVARTCIAFGGGHLEIGLELGPGGGGALQFRFTAAPESAAALSDTLLQRLVDRLAVEVSENTASAVLEKQLPHPVDMRGVRELKRALSEETEGSGEEELQRRNDELLSVLRDLQLRQEELHLANQELADTNRGVLALYAELDDRAEQLRQANRLKDQFLSYLSHEFRTPLNSMSLLSKMLLDEMGGAITEAQATQVRLIRKSALDLLELVNDLLDLAKIEAGKLDVNVETVDLAEVFSALRGMMRPLTSSERVELIMEDTGGLPRLQTDPIKLAQILRNLISNALKFTVEGEVRVSARAAGGERMVFAVADTGIGIAPEEQERIFAEFEQVKTPLHRRQRGTGLGLSLSRRLASLLGGRLELDSTPGVGSTFRLVLPLVPPVPEAEPELVQAPEPAPASVDLGGLRVLVIDDDASSRYVVSEEVASAGGTTIEADGGRAGIDAALGERPGVIVLDLRMPGMDGFETLRVLQSDERTRSIPVVVNTARQLDATETAALLERVAAVVIKSPGEGPQPSELLRAIARAGGSAARN